MAGQRRPRHIHLIYPLTRQRRHQVIVKDPSHHLTNPVRNLSLPSPLVGCQQRLELLGLAPEAGWSPDRAVRHR